MLPSTLGGGIGPVVVNTFKQRPHVALALGIIVISFNKIKIDLHSILFGDILTVSSNDIWGMYIGVFLAIIFILLNWSSLLLVTV